MGDEISKGDYTMILSYYHFTDTEKKNILNSIGLLVDTREKKNEHIISYLEKHHIPYEKKSLSSGDYSFYIAAMPEYGIDKPMYFDNEIFVERKANLDELAGNFTRNRTRFEEEFSISPARRRYLIIENANYYDIVDESYSSSYNKKSFVGSLHSFNMRYNVQIVFMPDDKYTASYIIGLFKYYLKNLLNL